MRIIRLKAVSLCLGIRRSFITYIPYNDGSYDLADLSHPIKVFKNIIIENNNAYVLDTKEVLSNAEEIYFYKNRSVISLSQEVVEQSVLGALVMNLSSNMIDFYKEAIKDDIRFDESEGEYEYLIGLIYDYELNDDVNAKIWYDKALDKNFKYQLIGVDYEE